ncbi:MAG: DUF4831 family protein [Bacteroidales bacterium]|nr:DUF4831 family protein [Bacteroidales bacterium]
MKRILFLIFIIYSLSACSGLNKFVVTPLGQEPQSYKQRMVYSIPRTVFEVNVNYRKTIYLPGPYRKFSEKYLGISNYINDEKTLWEISGIEVSEFKEYDPENLLSLNLIRGKFTAGSYFKLSEQGLVLDPTGMVSEASVIPIQTAEAFPVNIDLSLKKNHKEKTDTLYKTIITDSSFVKIPVLRKQKEAKTIEQKAEEAANLIIKIRKRRLKLVDGEYDIFPEGEALEIAIAELNRTEKEYLSLFIGKIYTEEYSRSILVVPSGQSENTELFRFSESRGWLAEGSNDGQKISLSINPPPSMLKEDVIPEKMPLNTLFYRIPVSCTVQIKQAEKLIFDGRMSIYQSGIGVGLPVLK